MCSHKRAVTLMSHLMFWNANHTSLKTASKLSPCIFPYLKSQWNRNVPSQTAYVVFRPSTASPDAVQIPPEGCCQLGQSVGLSGRKWSGMVNWGICLCFCFSSLSLYSWREVTADSMSCSGARHSALVQQEFTYSQSFLKFVSPRPSGFLFPSSWPWSLKR